MKGLLALILYSYSLVAIGSNEIWLQDIDCKIIGPNITEVLSTEGSLVTYICTRNTNSITCSNTSQDGAMYGAKPSAITTYQIIDENKEVALWQASSHFGVILLDLTNNRYSMTSTTMLSLGLFNKNCVGTIRNY